MGEGKQRPKSGIKKESTWGNITRTKCSLLTCISPASKEPCKIKKAQRKRCWKQPQRHQIGLNFGLNYPTLHTIKRIGANVLDMPLWRYHRQIHTPNYGVKKTNTLINRRV